MRITNQMMINNSMNNVQVNKNQLNTYDNQLSTQKKINKPSDDPIIAIRALRLRTSLDQVSQYLDKNIPDASSWLDTTEGAINEANSIVTDLYGYCTQGASDSYSEDERKTLSTTLDKLRDAYYAEGDVEYAGRYVFTGYMTDTPLTYQSDKDAEDVDYQITQTFTRDDLETKKAYTNTYSNDDILNLNITINDETGNVVTPDVEDVHRFRLGYSDVVNTGNTADYAIKDKNGNVLYNVDEITDDANFTFTGDNADKKVVFNAQTGEILLNDEVYKDLYNNSDGFSFTYEKNNFKKGDCNPVMYYDCIDKFTTDKDGNLLNTEYKKENEDIEYNINFSQKLKVNTEAKDAFNLYLGRDIDDLKTAVTNVQDVQNQISQVESMMKQTQYQGEESQNKLSTIKEGLNKQLDLAKNAMTEAFEKGVGKMQKYQQQASLAKADVGNRETRLNLTKSRLTEQKTNFTNLKSENEDIDLEEVVIGYSSAQLVYNASLNSAGKVVQKSLLDFL